MGKGNGPKKHEALIHVPLSDFVCSLLTLPFSPAPFIVPTAQEKHCGSCADLEAEQTSQGNTAPWWEVSAMGFLFRAREYGLTAIWN